MSRIFHYTILFLGTLVVDIYRYLFFFISLNLAVMSFI